MGAEASTELFTGLVQVDCPVCDATRSEEVEALIAGVGEPASEVRRRRHWTR
jgi:hypothetical protein